MTPDAQPARHPPDRPRLVPLALLTLFALAAWAALPAAPDFDDPYIALHSARTLIRGEDGAYQVPALFGVTSPVHVAGLAALLATGLPEFDAMRLVSALGAAALAAALWMLGGAVGLGGWARGLLVVVTFASGLTWVQVASGLETSWTMAALAAAVAAHLTGRRGAVAALAGLLPWLRPDAAAAALLLLVTSIRSAEASKRARLLVVALLVAAPWPIWMYLDTGSWWPITMGAKARFFAEGCAPLADKAARLGAGAWAWWVASLPLGLGLLALAARPVGRLGLIAIAVTLAGFLVVMPGAAWHNHHRYLYGVVLPWAALGAAIAARAAGRHGVTLLAIAAVAALAHTPDYWRPNLRGAMELRAAVAWIEQRTPPDAGILVQDAGAAAVYGTRRLTDLVGLKSPLALETHAAVTWPTCGLDRGRAVADIAARSGARYLVTNADWESHFHLAEALRTRGFAVTPVRTPPPDWSGGYTIYALDAPQPDPPAGAPR